MGRNFTRTVDKLGVLEFNLGGLK
uniref:Uncharacterized protein n=1 Tax=Moniliophthora roreri TaxID=221103 RepID=A0A0W0FD50_MONRR